MSRRVLTLTVLALSVMVGIWFGRTALTGSADSSDLAVQKRLMCPQCTGVRLDTCDLTICEDMKADVHRRLAEGRTQDEIVNAYAAAYGPSILAEPTGLAETSVWLAWAGTALGAALLAAFLWAAGRPRRRLETSP